MEQNQPNSINVDGENHEIKQFSPGIQQAVFLYNKFSAQLQEQQIEVMKTQAALQQIGMQITEAVKIELAQKAAEDAVDDVESKTVDGEAA